MSIINSISKCRSPIASGADREVFYSRKYDVIIKKDKCEPDFQDRGEQMENEYNLFLRLTEEEKKVYPIIDVVKYKDEYVVLMKRCQCLGKIAGFRKLLNSSKVSNVNSRSEMEYVCDYFGFDSSNLDSIFNFIDKYSILDIHPWNLGVLNNQLVIIDAGY